MNVGRGRACVLIWVALLGAGCEPTDDIFVPAPIGVGGGGSDSGSVGSAADAGSASDARVPPPAPDASTSVDAGQGSASDAGSADAGGSAPQDSGAADAGAAPADSLDALRTVCVDTINAYRATLSLPPVTRATSSQETCSDMGAAKDAKANAAHSSAFDCEGFNAQNTCPGWGYGSGTGNATLADALKGCLKMMWEEGPAPSSTCDGECFQKHGHFLNMSNPKARVVACGFFDMGGNKFWMNQDFKG